MSTDPREEAPAGDELAAWRRAYRESLPAGSADCPPDGELAALIVGAVDGDARLRLADHVVGCRRCAEAYRMLEALDREASRSYAEAANSRPPWRRIAGWAAAAALLVIAGVAVLQLPRGDGAGERVVRGAADAAWRVEPSDGARLPEPPRRFAWGAEEAGSWYRVVVYDAESVPLWESERTRRTVLDLPATLRERLAPGGTFYWRVRIDGERGGRASPLHRFEIGR